MTRWSTRFGRHWTSSQLSQKTVLDAAQAQLGNKINSASIHAGVVGKNFGGRPNVKHAKSKPLA